MSGIRNQWYVASASSRLGKKPRATRVLDLDLVLFRDRDGSARALLDRCAHRGVKLSLGRMTEGSLACAYHGWRFDGTGACVHIPSLVRGQRIAAGCTVPAFRTLEQDGYVWIWVGDSEPAPAPPLRIPGFDRTRWVQGTIDMKCEPLKIIENNFDWCHTFFAHPDTHPAYYVTKKYGFREYQYEMRVSERGLDVFTPVTSSESDPIPAAPLARLSYEIPHRLTVELHAPKRLRIVMHVVPTSSNTCRLEWLVEPNPVPLWPRQLTWSPREPKIFKQDRLLIESSQPWYDREPDPRFERSVEADASTLMVRRMYDMALAGTWQQEWSSLPKRRLVDVRA
jgi:phenylpropionate dioxygenase-like ring-hydroxylating dioxygenase large terminal subunit